MRVDARPDNRPDARRERTWRDDRDAHGTRDARLRDARPAPAERAEPAAAGGFVHDSLEKLREEVRWISQEAPSMDAPLLRLYIEAVTAETRGLQSRAGDPADGDIAAKIMRALTAIVSEHRPGHVYGLARHHQADWEDLARRARAQMASEGHDGSALDG